MAVLLCQVPGANKKLKVHGYGKLLRWSMWEGAAPGMSRLEDKQV